MMRLAAMGALAWAACSFAQNMEYRAKLAIDSGGILPSAPLFTDSPAGQDLPPCRIINAFSNGMIVFAVREVRDPGADPISRHRDESCMVTIWMKGYRKVTAALHDGTVIVMKPLGDPEGSTVSVTALHVPKEAAKAYDKGIASLSDGKLPGAQKQFERAVELYPDYAQAWSQLGEVFEQISQPDQAIDACRHALKADPKYARPYLQLMRLAVNGKRMEDAAALGDRALKQDPTEFPGIYYYAAVANHDLKHADAAQKLAERAIELDKGEDYPAGEALLGKILADKGDSRGAVEHFNKYLKLAPKAGDVDDIRERIAALQK